MKRLPIDLMTLTFHIHSQFEKIMDNKSFANKMCICRERIFERFTYTVEKLIIKLGSRTLKFLEDYNFEISTDMTNLQKWFNDEIYEILYEDLEVSNKMILTFQLIQEHQDEKFFKLISDKYENILISLKNGKIDDVNIELNDLYEEIRAWYELFIYMILSTQFNCQSIKDTFLSDNNVAPDIQCDQSECGPLDHHWCIHHNTCNKCEIHEGVIDNGEKISIIMTNDFIDDMFWLEKLMYIVENYHTNPENINLVLDYRMYDQLIQCKLSHDHYDKLLNANKVFKHISIKNHEGINFNGYFEKLKHLIE